MPTNQSPGTNQLRCDACGRFFNTEDELRTHQQDCIAAQQSGAAAPKGATRRKSRPTVNGSARRNDAAPIEGK